jgi:BirA family biotin operon repressor/biotin-[acetyl-CoA-carboxylase] ligase
LQLDYKSISLNTKWIKSGLDSIIYRESMDSTLDIALNKDYQAQDSKKVVVTDNQTSGQGTHGKKWISTPYKDLTFSLILGRDYYFEQNLIDQCCIGMLNVLSTYNIEGQIKYPNDIYVNNKKIIGMLLSNVQNSKENNKPYQALSIGINVNSVIDIKKLDSQAKVSSTSLFLELNREINREKLLKLIIEEIDLIIQKLVHQ